MVGRPDGLDVADVATEPNALRNTEPLAQAAQAVLAPTTTKERDLHGASAPSIGSHQLQQKILTFGTRIEPTDTSELHGFVGFGPGHFGVVPHVEGVPNDLCVRERDAQLGFKQRPIPLRHEAHTARAREDVDPDPGILLVRPQFLAIGLHDDHIRDLLRRAHAHQRLVVVR